MQNNGSPKIGLKFNGTKISLTLLMESSALFYTIFLWCLLLSITGYSIYVGFGPPSKELRDPFEEHED
jgi:PsbN protein